MFKRIPNISISLAQQEVSNCLTQSQPLPKILKTIDNKKTHLQPTCCIRQYQKCIYTERCPHKKPWTKQMALKKKKNWNSSSTITHWVFHQEPVGFWDHVLYASYPWKSYFAITIAVIVNDNKPWQTCLVKERPARHDLSPLLKSRGFLCKKEQFEI